MASTASSIAGHKGCALLVVVALLIATATEFVHSQAQLPQPLASPNLNLLGSGRIYAIARQPDGGTVIAGEFTSIDGVPRRNIARRKPNGALDLHWNPSINERVMALAVDATGAVYAAGVFYEVDGQSRSSIAKLTASGELDASWNSGFVGGGLSVAVDGDGNVFASGYFEVPVSGDRYSLVKLSSTDGSLDSQWQPGFEGSGPNALAIDSDWLYVGGFMQAMGGLPRRNLARVSRLGTGAVDAAWAPQPNGTVSSIAVAPNGAVFIAGSFNYVEQQPRPGVAKIAATGNGAVDASWSPNLDFGANGFPRTVSIDASGSILVGARWEHEIGTPPPAHASLVKVSATGAGAVDPGWNPMLKGSVHAISVGADGSIDAGGGFVTDAAAPALGLATINAAGEPAASLGVEAPSGIVKAIALQADGGMVVGGRFARVNGQTRRNLLRLNADGSVDANWNPASNGDVVALATRGGSLFAAGRFTQVNGSDHHGIAKLAPAGSGAPDPGWTSPITAGAVGTIVIGVGDSVFAGGDFQTGTLPIRNLAKLSAVSGVLDPSWNPAPDGLVNSLALDSNGHLFASGRFSTIGGASRNAIAKLSSVDAVVDASWNPSIIGVSSVVNLIAIDAGDTLYAAGSNLFALGLQPRRLVRFPAQGGGALDAAWNPSSTNQGEILALAIANNGTLYTSERRVASLSPPIFYFYQSSKLRTDDGGTPDPAWRPSIQGHVGVMAAADGVVYLGGNFVRIGNQARFALAALPGSVSDVIFAQGFD